jgi:predicted acylesterase/phospholipase RssA/catechol 2,3-dioxygenase-like lactoylglutathione lyase family enzyme
MQTRHRLPYIVLYVADLDASERFYTTTLGLRVRDFPVASVMGEHARALSLQGTTLLLVQKDGGNHYFFPDGEHGRAAGTSFPSFEVTSLEAFHGDALNARVKCLKPPSGDNFGRMAVYEDPDGLMFTVVEPAPQPASHGIVFSGGGAYGAFELGVLRALATNPALGIAGPTGPHVPQVMTGTSVGAYNAAYLTCGLGGGKTFERAVEDLIRIWINRIAGSVRENGVYRLRGDVMQWEGISSAVDDAMFFTRDIAKRMSYAIAPPPLLSKLLEIVDVSTLFSVEPLRKLVEDTISWHCFQRSPCQLQIAAADWNDGQLRLFGHGCKPSDQEEAMTEQNVWQSVLASTAIPGIFPPVDVDCAGPNGREIRSFVDGGLLMNSPLNPAIDVGANVIHLICLNPEVSSIPLCPVGSTLSVMQRAVVTAVAGNIQSDLDRAGLVNRVAGILRRKHSDEFYRPITIHRYHPTPEVLDGLPGILDFSRGHIEKLIANGEKLASGHDCKRARCVLPQ